MSDKITELMTYAAMRGDPKLMSLLAGAMGDIEVSENPKRLARASRAAASVGIVISGIAKFFNYIAISTTEYLPSKALELLDVGRYLARTPSMGKSKNELESTQGEGEREK